MANYTLDVNGKQHQVDVESDTPLLWVLRDHLNLTGTKFGCGVHLDGAAVRSCSTPISTVGDMAVTTIEGLSDDGSHPVQQAWMEHDVPQCGYCQAGQIMTAVAFLKSNPAPTDDAIEQAMNGNLCRCGTYLRIRAAVKTASSHL